MASKVRIAAGQLEFEYEGEADLSVADIKELFSYVEALAGTPAATPSATAPSQAATSGAHASAPTTPPAKKLHVNSIATALQAKTATDLAVAAAAALQIFEGKEKFTRAELLESMKKATLHFKDTMTSNLTKTIGTLIGSKFNQVSDGVYSLTAAAHAELDSKFA